MNDCSQFVEEKNARVTFLVHLIDIHGEEIVDVSESSILMEGDHLSEMEE